MDILHVIFQMLTGGAETMLVDIVNEQVRRGHEVEILIVNRGEEPAVMAALDRRVKVSRFDREPGAAPMLLMARLNLWVLRRRPDVIHLHMHKLCGLLRVMRGRAVFTVHDLKIPMGYAASFRMAAISDAVRDDVLGRVPGADIRVVRNGINMAAVSRREKSMPGDKVRIVQVSRLVAEKKGQDILIDALRLLSQRGIDASVTFIGDGIDRDMLRARAEGLDVTFAGNLPRSEVYKSLKDYDIMCHPARYEGFGLTVAEGMAAGLPLVVPEGGGPWEVADKGRLAEVFAQGSAEGCAEAIARIIEDYPAAMARVDKARAYVEANFSVSRMVTEYERLYQNE